MDTFSRVINHSVWVGALSTAGAFALTALLYEALSRDGDLSAACSPDAPWSNAMRISAIAGGATWALVFGLDVAFGYVLRNTPRALKRLVWAAAVAHALLGCTLLGLAVWLVAERGRRLASALIVAALAIGAAQFYPLVRMLTRPSSKPEATAQTTEPAPDELSYERSTSSFSK